MSKELIVHSSQHETRLAILEEDQLVELHVENESQHALAGKSGLPLPLMSYGGSNLLATFMLLGLVNNVRLRRFTN